MTGLLSVATASLQAAVAAEAFLKSSMGAPSTSVYLRWSLP